MLADGGKDLSDYSTAFEIIFAYIVKSQLRDRISFTDYYPASKLPPRRNRAIEFFDPVKRDQQMWHCDYTGRTVRRL